eukprot:tig00020597_g11705.t1
MTGDPRASPKTEAYIEPGRSAVLALASLAPRARRSAPEFIMACAVAAHAHGLPGFDLLGSAADLARSAPEFIMARAVAAHALGLPGFDLLGSAADLARAARH